LCNNSPIESISPENECRLNEPNNNLNLTKRAVAATSNGRRTIMLSFVE
jgi:hypothetical protein